MLLIFEGWQEFAITFVQLHIDTVRQLFQHPFLQQDVNCQGLRRAACRAQTDQPPSRSPTKRGTPSLTSAEGLPPEGRTEAAQRNVLDEHPCDR